MDDVEPRSAARFARAAADYCAWATGPGDADLAALTRVLAELVAAGLGLGLGEGEFFEVELDQVQRAAVRARVASLPIQYYGEVYDVLQVPAGEACLGDLCDDLVDVHAEVAVGLALWQAGRHRDAAAHWRWSMRIHWLRHASSALRVLCCALAEGWPGSDE